MRSSEAPWNSRMMRNFFAIPRLSKGHRGFSGIDLLINARYDRVQHVRTSLVRSVPVDRKKQKEKLTLIADATPTPPPPYLFSALPKTVNNFPGD